MAAITKRTYKSGEVKFQVSIRLKGFPPLSASFERKTDARDWAATMEAEIRSGRYFTGAALKKITVGKAIDRYLEEVLPNKSPSTVPGQQQQLLWWKSQIGEILLTELNTAAVAACRSMLSKEPIRSLAKAPAKGRRPRYRSASTIVSYLAVLSHVCTIAMKEWEWMDRNPVANIRRPTLNNARTRFLSDEERKRLLTECINYPDLHLAVLLSLTTGARRSEIWELKWHQIDFDRRMITLYKTKNKQIRGLCIADEVLPLLVARKKQVNSRPTDFLFPGLTKDKSFDFTGQWRQVLHKAKLEQFRYHDLRHTAASYLAMQGATAPEIAEIMGHKTLQMVKRYSHFTATHNASLVSLLAARIFQN